jgi:hypothetical protein
VAGRAQAFSNPTVIALASEQFIPVAENSSALERQQDDKGEFFRHVAEQGHYGGRVHPTRTRQGSYAFTAEGQFLASVNTRDPQGMADMLRTALARWQEGYADGGPSPVQLVAGQSDDGQRWVIHPDGFHDRRLDRDSVASEWPSSRQRPGNYLAWFWGAGCEITSTAEVTEQTEDIPRAARECLAPGAEVIPQPDEPYDPPEGAVPGQGDEFLGPFRNQVVSDVPHNLDYSFRAGIFMGDYNSVAFPNVPEGEPSTRQALGFWTDARNGRGSAGEVSQQPGRNPACEQSDVFIDDFNPLTENNGQSATQGMELFLVTPCPTDAVGERDRQAGSGG